MEHFILLCYKCDWIGEMDEASGKCPNCFSTNRHLVRGTKNEIKDYIKNIKINPPKNRINLLKN